MGIYDHTVLIYNPAAGNVHRTGGRIIQYAVDALEREGIIVLKLPTTGPGTASEIVRRALADDP